MYTADCGKRNDCSPTWKPDVKIFEYRGAW